MKECCVEIREIKQIKPEIFIISFKSSYIAKRARPSQFIHIKVDDFQTILRRPISIHKVIGDTVYFLFKVRGRGTKILSSYKKGDSLNLIGPLGNGFKPPTRDRKNTVNLLLGAGVGVAPMLFLAQELVKRNGQNRGVVLLAGKTKSDILCRADFVKLGYKVYISTEDGSLGYRGNIINLLQHKVLPKVSKGFLPGEFKSNLYACGPEKMLVAIKPVIKSYPKVCCQVSFEQFMGCGVGICCGCSLKTKSGYQKVCKDGPVFDLNNVI